MRHHWTYFRENQWVTREMEWKALRIKNAEVLIYSFINLLLFIIGDFSNNYSPGHVSIVLAIIFQVIFFLLYFVRAFTWVYPFLSLSLTFLSTLSLLVTHPSTSLIFSGLFILLVGLLYARFWELFLAKIFSVSIFLVFFFDTLPKIPGGILNSFSVGRWYLFIIGFSFLIYWHNRSLFGQVLKLLLREKENQNRIKQLAFLMS